MRIINTLLFLCMACVLNAAPLKPVQLKCEYTDNPLGIDIAAPLLSWKTESTERNKMQTAYEIMVALSESDLAQNKGQVWKSGKKATNKSNNIAYAGKKLTPFTRYYWKVRVWDEKGEVSNWSPAAWFETAMLVHADWKAQWIGDGKKPPVNDADFYNDDPAPMFRKTFTAKKPVKDARLYIAGIGYYEASINGKKVGDHVLDPGWTNYGKQIMYTTYDITSMLGNGDNAVGVILGNGFYNPLPIRIFLPLREYLYIGRPCVKAQIRITYEDGSVETVVTDNSWKTAPSAIMRNNVYLGEHYDARNETNGWNETSFNDSQWQQSALADIPTGELTAQMQPPIRVTQVIKPTRMTETVPGEFVFDMGQNFAGVVRLKVQGPKGTKIRIRYGEDAYSDGRVNVMTSVAGQRKTVWNANREVAGEPQTAWQEDFYTLKGDGEEIWSPRFTFHGFRYVEITGWPGRPTLDNIEGLRMNSDLTQTGQFECSNEMFNKINKAIDYTFKSNIFSVQSDCPAREKFGYGGDIVGTAKTFCWYYDMENFYRKVARDFVNDQRPLGGMTETAPYNGLQDQGLGDNSGPIGWQLGFAFVEKQLYDFYGDTRTFETHYSALVKQVEFLRSAAKDNIIEKCINDHESLEERIPSLFATAHYYHHVIILAEFAGLLNKKDDAAKYTRLASDIKNAFIGKFVTTKDGKVGNATQGAQAMGLFYNLLPDGEKDQALNGLVQAIDKWNGHIAAGIFGVPAILDLLREYNRNDIGYEMVNKKAFPGWGYMIQRGATTIWETWQYSDNTFSQNHPMFGSVGEWFYQTLLGINAAAPGFEKIVVKPQPAGDLTWAKGSFESVKGTIRSDWKIENGKFLFNVSVPANTTAEIWVPSKDNNSVTEGNKAIANIADLKFVRQDNGFSVYSAGSGSYSFVSTMP